MAEALAYFDTSVLIKRYVEEPGSAYARRLMRRYHLLSSVITPVEAVSAVARRYRAGEVTRTHFDAIVARMHADRLYWGLGRARRRGAGSRRTVDRADTCQEPRRFAHRLRICTPYGIRSAAALRDRRRATA